MVKLICLYKGNSMITNNSSDSCYDLQLFSCLYEQLFSAFYKKQRGKCGQMRTSGVPNQNHLVLDKGEKTKQTRKTVEKLQ